MPTKKIQGADGRVMVVDAQRWAAIDAAFRANPQQFTMDGRTARDTGEAIAFVVSQLAYTENQVFERLYQPLQYEQFIPISGEAGEWATSVRYEIYDYTGRGKRSSGKGRDINLVGVAYADKTFPVFNGDIGYDYNMEELRTSAFLRRPVSDTKISAAIEGYRRHLNEVALMGDPSSNATGLFNNTLVPQGNAPTGNWAMASPANILKDINTGITSVWTSTAFNDQVTDVIIAPTAYAFIASTPRSDNSDKTILQYVIENNVAKVQRGININFQPGFGLDTAGAGGTRRMMFYVKSPSRLKMHVPLPLRFLAPQFAGLAVEIPGEYKYAAPQFYYPKSASYVDGI